ncbi:MAG: hypothetical protein JO034_24555, partial [Singulisphaera sp.]|nr:hypothetical protein [Singulisphaera sp.]
MSGEQQPLCGPTELVDRLLEGRETGRHHHPETHGAISDAGVLHLVELSYFASQSVEEGRYPRFRLFVPSDNLPPSGADPWQLLRFSQPVPLLEVDDLRRLAPCAASHDFALEIEEQDNDQGKSIIACIGVRLAHSGEGGTKILSTSLWARHVR